MKVVLEETSAWPIDFAETGPSAAPAGEPRVVVGAIEPVKDYWQPWKARSLSWGVPAGSKLEIVKEAEDKSALEWPVIVVDSLVVNAQGEKIEARVTVLYFMLEWCAWIAVRGSPAQIAENRERALSVLLSARPDWARPEVAAIAQLYE